MMSDPEDLKFVDSSQDDVLFDKGDSQTHTFTNFPNSAADDEDEDTEDKSQLLKAGEKKAPSFWTFEYYQQFFDVETYQVGHRVLGSMLPLPNRNYLQTHIRPSPDLYGPFWICTTLVFTTAIAGNLANYLSSGGKDYQWRYDFHKVTFAATAIFSYWWMIPAMMYGLLWWRKSQAGYTFMEILCLYGYSLAIYIPISILWVINITWFKWLLVAVGGVLSGGVLVLTMWPAVREDTRQVALAVVGLVFLLHLALAAGFVLYFFHVPVAASTAQPIVTDKPAVTIKPTPAPPEAQKALALKTTEVPSKQGQGTGDSPASNLAPNTGTANDDSGKKETDVAADDEGQQAPAKLVKKDVVKDNTAAESIDTDKAELDALTSRKAKLVKRNSKLIRALKQRQV